MRRILIIEDNVAVRNELKIMLENNGYEGIILENFIDIVGSILDINPDLVLLDINLPGMNGQMILKKLRESSQVPVIMVTSSSAEMDEVLCMSYGADDYVTKPYNPMILVLRIEAIFKRMDNNSSDIIKYRDMDIMIKKGLIKCGDIEVSLTKNEMIIINFLLSRKGEIVTRDDIMTDLWDNDEFLNDNALTVNISRLRNKLRELGAEDVIETRKGQGYRLI